MDSLTSVSARANALLRHRGPDDAATVAAQQERASLTILRAIQRALEAAPPLTDEQVERVAARLRGGAA